jgi:hypothetical protein
MKITVECHVEKEIEINEKNIKRFFDIKKYEDDDGDIEYYLKDNKEDLFFDYLNKLEKELDTKMNGLEDIQILSFVDEEGNVIYES